jgi:uncharacterized protein YndB with AHSA1/START domain
MIDVAHQINAVQRRVGARVLEAGEARTVVVSRIYDAEIEDVWDACTSPERIPRWCEANVAAGADEKAARAAADRTTAAYTAEPPS